MGWFADPLVFGEYPLVMREMLGNRLPYFTRQQSIKLKGAYDFLALNHYSTKYFSTRKSTGVESTIDNQWAYDQNNTESNRGLDGQLIGDQVPLYLSNLSVCLFVCLFFFAVYLSYSLFTYSFIHLFQADSSWLNVYPPGFYKTLRWSSDRYTVKGRKPVIYVTENGCDVPGEGALPFDQVILTIYSS